MTPCAGRMRRWVLIVVVLVAVSGGMPARAQQPPADGEAPHSLLRRWHTEQSDLLADVQGFSAREEASWTLDGPFGLRRMAMTARLTGHPDQEDWNRDVESVRADGRPVPPERWRRMHHRRSRPFGPEAEAMTRSVLRLPRLVRQMRLASDPTPVHLDDRRLWRFDLVPHPHRSVVERMTLWLTPDATLYRSRLLFRLRQHHDAPFIVTTDYARVEGIDVPTQRHIEGIAQRRRRERTFSMLFDYTATYDDYRFSFEDVD